MKKFFHNNKTGQTLIESMIAISVMMVGLMGALILLNSSLGLNRVVADNYIATYLGSEGIEVIKNLIDANIIQKDPWNDCFQNGYYEVVYNLKFGNGGSKCNMLTFMGNFGSDADALNFENKTLSYDNQGRYSYNGSIPTTYKRLVKITLVSQNEVAVNSLVSWVTRGSGSQVVNFEDHFTNWRPQN